MCKWELNSTGKCLLLANICSYFKGKVSITTSVHVLNTMRCWRVILKIPAKVGSKEIGAAVLLIDLHCL